MDVPNLVATCAVVVAVAVLVDKVEFVCGLACKVLLAVDVAVLEKADVAVASELGVALDKVDVLAVVAVFDAKRPVPEAVVDTPGFEAEFAGEKLLNAEDAL